MIGFPGDGDFPLLYAHDSLNYSYIHIFLIKDRSLFDMEFKKCSYFPFRSFRHV